MDNDKTSKSMGEPKAAEALGDSVVVRPITEEQPSSADADTPKAAAAVPEAEEANAGTESKKDKTEKEELSEEEAKAEAEAAAEAESDRHLKEAIAEQAREDERPHSSNFTLGKILGGDILTAQMFRNNIWLIVLIVGFAVVYITNRYKVQKDLLEIDKLNTQLEDAKYRALSSSSNLTEKSRESHVIETLSNGPDSSLKQSDRPPYIIEVPDK